MYIVVSLLHTHSAYGKGISYCISVAYLFDCPGKSSAQVAFFIAKCSAKSHVPFLISFVLSSAFDGRVQVHFSDVELIMSEKEGEREKKLNK